MNKEEILNKYIDLIDKGYCSDCNELNCIDNFPHSKITHAIRELQQENKQLKEQLLVAQTNEETFRLEMEDITRALGLAEDTLFDDVKVYARSLKDNWNKLKVYIKTEIPEDVFIDTEWFVSILDKMKELEQGSDSDE